LSYLPFNRGAHPNFWSFIEKTQAGVSIHKINKGIDTGNIILRKKINIFSTLLSKDGLNKNSKQEMPQGFEAFFLNLSMTNILFFYDCTILMIKFAMFLDEFYTNSLKIINNEHNFSTTTKNTPTQTLVVDRNRKHLYDVWRMDECLFGS
jgi:methionyl-tRNA formyltransferase